MPIYIILYSIHKYIQTTISNIQEELEANLNREQNFDSEQIEKFGFFLESSLLGGLSENAGFSLCIERLLMWFLREDNIKNLIPFPRFATHSGRGALNP